MKSISRTELIWIADALSAHAQELSSLSESDDCDLCAILHVRSEQLTELSSKLKGIAQSGDKRIAIE